MRPEAATTIGRLWALSALACAVLLAGCAALPRDATERAWAEYEEVLRRLEAAGPGLEEGSAAERLAIDRFQRLLSDFKAPDFRSDIRLVYADDVFFNDTLKTLHGVDEVEEHLAATADALEQGTVEFVDLAVQDGDYYFRWEMLVRLERRGDSPQRRSLP